MKNIHRFTTTDEAIDFLVNEFGCDATEATWFVYEERFTIGTDRALWLNVSPFVTGS